MSERLALIAGSGALVPAVIAAARARGFALLLLTISRRGPIEGITPIRFSLAAPQSAIEAMRAFGATAFTLAGGVTLSDIVREGLAGFFGSGEKASLGDSRVSDLVLRVEELTGARPMGVHEIAPHLLAPEGLVGGPAPDDVLAATARHALDLARRAGDLDLGQAVVVAGRRAVAAEDVGGTDALLRRVGWLKLQRRVTGGAASPLVLGKCPKPDQSLLIDMPAIGSRTVRNARRAGLSAIAVEAGATLLIDPPAIRSEADRLGITVLGLGRG